MGSIQYGRPASSLSSPTIILIIANILMFVVLLIGGDEVFCLLALVWKLFFQEHYYWQLFTSMFVHFDISHILFNMFGLYYFGRLNEVQFSKTQYLAIYLGSGLVGNIATLFLLPHNAVSAGASGAIFGLLGSYVVLARKFRNMGFALIYAVLILVYSSIGPGVNIFAHLFGLVGGLVLGLIFSHRRHSGGYDVSYTLTS